jgi:hypothetical protein
MGWSRLPGQQTVTCDTRGRHSAGGATRRSAADIEPRNEPERRFDRFVSRFDSAAHAGRQCRPARRI